MGHFAHLSDSGDVLEVIVLSNEVLGEPTLTFPDTEGAGRAFIANTLKLPGLWRQTSFSGSFRGKFAAIGDLFDEEADEFRSPVAEPAAE